MRQQLVMQVEKSVGLTGLGVLLLPQGPAPRLLQPALHTQWAVELVFPDGREMEATASIEEITRPADSPAAATTETRALLLTQAGAGWVPAGTRVYLLNPDG